MTESIVVMCDGPGCTEQREGGTLVPHKWITANDFGDVRMVTYHFCSWTCLDQFSDAKVVNP